MDTPGLVEIVPQGDVVLLLEKSELSLKIRVSSHILALGSSVFKTMLAPRFKEGTILAATSAVEIPLPDDDPQAMSTICQILHLRNEQLPRKPDAAHILCVARLVDKYNCTEAVKPTAESWISQHLDTADCSTLFTLLESAYYFRHAQCLQQISSRLILNSKEPLTAILFEPALETCPEALATALLALEVERKEAFNAAAGIVENRIEQHRAWHVGYICPKACNDLQMRFSSLVDQLFCSDLWPASKLQSNALRVSISRMKALNLKALSITCDNRWHERNDRRPSFEYTNLTVQAEAQKLEEFVSKICYECVLEGRGGWNLKGKCHHHRT